KRTRPGLRDVDTLIHCIPWFSFFFSFLFSGWRGGALKRLGRSRSTVYLYRHNPRRLRPLRRKRASIKSHGILGFGCKVSHRKGAKIKQEPRFISAIKVQVSF